MTRDLDACRDAAALVRAVHGRDTEGQGAILKHADHEALAGALAAYVVAMLRGVACCDHCVGVVLGDWQADLRAASMDGGPG